MNGLSFMEGEGEAEERGNSQDLCQQALTLRKELCICKGGLA